MYNLVLYEFCDYYLELIKPYFHLSGAAADQRSIRNVLFVVVDTFLRLMSPVMPFVTEEVGGYALLSVCLGFPRL